MQRRGLSRQYLCYANKGIIMGTPKHETPIKKLESHRHVPLTLEIPAPYQGPFIIPSILLGVAFLGVPILLPLLKASST